jgi:nicotinate phosphoribosyltransferase
MSSHWVNDDNAAMLTDLYELTMLESYFAHGMNDIAVFDLFVRRLPKTRNYLVACGLEDVLRYLETFSFSTEHLSYLKSLNRFSGRFIDSLGRLHFTGDVYAVPEGTVVFANEPIVEIVAPLPEAQIVETFLINQIHLQSLAASKAARVVTAARGRAVIDYGLRRIHGTDAGLKAARAFYIAGIDGTSNVLAGEVYSIPLSGTMAHSFVQAHDSEYEAFRHFLESFPDGTLLVDTYDTLDGVRNVIRLAASNLGSDFHATAIRLDSGDLAALAKESRRMLNEAALTNVKIFASSSLDEYAIEELLRTGAPIDGFGVGTHMGTSADSPFLDAAYKLVEYAGSPRMKLSTGKALLPGRKQIFRTFADSIATHDVIACFDENLPGTALLKPVMLGGRRTAGVPSLDESRSCCRKSINQLPQTLLGLQTAAQPYDVKPSPRLSALEAECRTKIERGRRFPLG